MKCKYNYKDKKGISEQEMKDILVSEYNDAVKEMFKASRSKAAYKDFLNKFNIEKGNTLKSVLKDLRSEFKKDLKAKNKDKTFLNWLTNITAEDGSQYNNLQEWIDDNQILIPGELEPGTRLVLAFIDEEDFDSFPYGNGVYSSVLNKDRSNMPMIAYKVDSDGRRIGKGVFLVPYNKFIEDRVESDKLSVLNENIKEINELREKAEKNGGSIEVIITEKKSGKISIGESGTLREKRFNSDEKIILATVDGTGQLVNMETNKLLKEDEDIDVDMSFVEEAKRNGVQLEGKVLEIVPTSVKGKYQARFTTASSIASTGLVSHILELFTKYKSTKMRMKTLMKALNSIIYTGNKHLRNDIKKWKASNINSKNPIGNVLFKLSKKLITTDESLIGLPVIIEVDNVIYMGRYTRKEEDFLSDFKGIEQNGATRGNKSKLSQNSKLAKDMGIVVVSKATLKGRTGSKLLGVIKDFLMASNKEVKKTHGVGKRVTDTSVKLHANFNTSNELVPEYDEDLKPTGNKITVKETIEKNYTSRNETKNIGTEENPITSFETHPTVYYEINEEGKAKKVKKEKEPKKNKIEKDVSGAKKSSKKKNKKSKNVYDEVIAIINEHNNGDGAMIGLRKDGSGYVYVDPHTGIETTYYRATSIDSTFDKSISGKPHIVEAIARGNLMDDVLRLYLQNSDMTDKAFIKMFKAKYKSFKTLKHKGKKTGNNLSKFSDKAILKYKQEIDTFIKANKDFYLITDLSTVFGVINGKNVAGTVDIIGVNKKTGEVIIVDLKSSSRNRGNKKDSLYNTLNDSDTKQLSIYASLIAQRLGIEVKSIYILPFQVKKESGEFRNLENSSTSKNKMLKKEFNKKYYDKNAKKNKVNYSEKEKYTDEEKELMFQDHIINEVNDEVLGIEGISIPDKYLIVNYVTQIANTLLNEDGTLDFEDIRHYFKNYTEEMIDFYQKEIRAIRDNVSAPNLVMLNELNNNLKIAKIANENVDVLVNAGKAKFLEMTNAREIEDSFGNFVDDVEGHDFTKESFEVDPKKGASAKLKRFYDGIEMQKIKTDDNNRPVIENGEFTYETVTGPMGVPLYIGYDTVDNTIKSIIISENQSEHNLESMIVALEEQVQYYPYLAQVIEKLRNEETPQNVKNLFVKENARDNLVMTFTMMKENHDGTYSVSSYYTNQTSVSRVIRQEWETNIFRDNKLVKINPEEGKYFVDKELALNSIHEIAESLDINLKEKGVEKELNSLLREISESFKEKVDTDELTKSQKKALRKVLKLYGINISKVAFDKLIDSGYYMTTDKSSENIHISFSDMFFVSPNSSGIFGNIFSNLNNIISTEGEIRLDTIKNSPLNSLNANILIKIANIQSKFSHHKQVTSFRDAGKSVYANPLGKFATEQTSKFKNNKEFRKKYKDHFYSKNSMYMHFLDSSNKFRNRFYLDHMGLNAFKEVGKKVYGKNKINSVTNMDYDIIEFGQFSSINYEASSNKTFMGVPVRAAKMFFPTMSDKSQMLVADTMVLDIDSTNFTNDDYIVGEDIYNVMYSQLIEPELNRLAESLIRGDEAFTKSYLTASKLFLMIPSLNNVSIDGGTIKDLMLSATNEDVEMVDGKYTLNFSNVIKEAAIIELSKVVKAEASRKYKEMKEDFIDNNSIKYIDKKYLEFLADENKKYKANSVLKRALTDFTINKMIALANVSMLYTGDNALYSKLKEEDLNKEGFELLDSIEDKVFNNFGKRAALLLAPRAKVANSSHEQYLQVFLEDHFVSSTNIEFLVDVLSDKTISEEDLETIEEYNAILNSNLTNMTKDLQKRFKKVEKKYPEVAPFFNIEVTDGQEYTTASEHIDTMFKLGELSEKAYYSIKTKINAQLEYLKYNQGKQLPRELLLPKDDIKLIMQSRKPVHSGQRLNEETGVMEMVYIKSSSIPLLPEWTQTKSINKLRLLLEELEEKQEKEMVVLSDGNYFTRSKRGVRASFSSANKLGAPNETVSVFDGDGFFNDDVGIEHIEKASKVLDRANWGIQQHKPVSFNQNKRNTQKLGSQLLRIAFGDGVNSEAITFYKEDGSKISGKELAEEFDENWLNLIKEKRDKFNKDFGILIDPVNGETIIPDKLKTANKLAKILQEEAEKRGYGYKDKKGLKHSVEIVLEHAGEIEIFDENKEYDDSYRFRKDDEGNDISYKVISKSSHFIPLDKVNEEGYLEEFAKKRTPKGAKYVGSDINVVDVSFSIPIWLSPNGNKLEALLNSIVSNRILNINLPGNDFVISSEAAFFDDFSEDIKSNIIYTSAYNHEEGRLQGVNKDEKTGEITPNQVFLPSRLRNPVTNELIEFFLEDGTPNKKYVKEVDGKLQLKEEMIPLEVLNHIAFRIPTSGHISASRNVVAGILPSSVGDLMVIPSNIMPQKGVDYDFDTEKVYSPNVYMSITGEFAKLNSKKHKDLQRKDEKYYKSLMEVIEEKEGVKKIYNKYTEAVENLEKYKSTFSLANDKFYNNKLLKKENRILQLEKKLKDSLSLINKAYEVSRKMPNLGLEAIDKLADKIINSEEVEFTEDCNGAKAEKGMEFGFKTGGEWGIVKKFEGPSHKQGGIDITLTSNGVKLKRNNSNFKAEKGLIIPKDNNNE